jgi:hypothetical protein
MNCVSNNLLVSKKSEDKIDAIDELIIKKTHPLEGEVDPLELVAPPHKKTNLH